MCVANLQANGLELTIQKAKKLQIKQSELKPFEDMLHEARLAHAAKALEGQLKMKVKRATAADGIEPLRNAIESAKKYKVDKVDVPLVDAAEKRLKELKITAEMCAAAT